MPKQVPFNDFFLLGLSHLEKFLEEGKIKPNAKAEMGRRIKYGKKLVREQTHRGDLIAFEATHRWSFQQYKAMLKRLYKTAGKPLPEERLRYWWDGIAKDHLGFYAEIADYAKSIGRKVASLETMVRKPGGGLYFAYASTMPSTQRFERIKYLLTKKANLSFFKKVQGLKPKMVVVAGGHAVYLEAVMKPKSVDYFPRLSQATKARFLKLMEADHVTYLTKKKQRLVRKRELTRRQRKQGK